jgi:hypothetical protein
VWRHDIENVRLHGGGCGELNFPLGTDEPIPELVAPPAPGHVVQLAWEDREAQERLEVYMANLCCNNPERVAEEAADFTRYEELRCNGGGGGADDDLYFSVFDDDGRYI